MIITYGAITAKLPNARSYRGHEAAKSHPCQDQPAITLMLPHGSIMSLKPDRFHWSRRAANSDARQAMIECLTGQLWVTQEDDSSDYLLATGDCFFLRKNRLVVIQAMEPTTFLLSEISVPPHR